MKTLISLFALVMFAAVSLANDCRQRIVVHHQQAQVVQHAAVQQYAVQQNHVQNYAAAYVAQYVAVPLVVPAYTVAYTKDSSDEIGKLRDELKAIREALKTQPPTPSQPAEGTITVPLTQRKAQQADHDGAKILVVSCSKCHDVSNAKNKGGGFVLTNGASLAPLNDSQVLAIVREIYSGRMPKGTKLSDADVGAVIEWIDTRK